MHPMQCLLNYQQRGSRWSYREWTKSNDRRTITHMNTQNAHNSGYGIFLFCFLVESANFMHGKACDVCQVR